MLLRVAIEIDYNITPSIAKNEGQPIKLIQIKIPIPSSLPYRSPKICHIILTESSERKQREPPKYEIPKDESSGLVEEVLQGELRV